jgi:hypothetical protein
MKGVFFLHCTSIKAQKLVPAKASVDMPTQVHYMFLPCSRIRQAKDKANPNPHILQFLRRKAMFFFGAKISLFLPEILGCKPHRGALIFFLPLFAKGQPNTNLKSPLDLSRVYDV